MLPLQNDTTTAAQRATTIANAISALTNSGIITKDSKTTVAGNLGAHSAIDLVKTTEKQMVEVVSSMSKNIHSLSSSFQAMDQQLGTNFSTLDNASTRFSLNE